jgi:hypothetical protein
MAPKQTPAQPVPVLTKAEKQEEAQRARAQRAAAMGPGRIEAEDVLADVIATMDLDARRMKLKAEDGEYLTVSESQCLGNYARVLAQAIQVKQQRRPGEEGLDDDEVAEKAEAIRKKYKHAEKQRGAS